MMDETIRCAVERAIGTMREHLGEQVTIDDMARSAMFSKFYFSRMFHQATGVSPGRFLAAMRLAEAKRLLLSTSITVADISNRVGYASVGTFSSRFSSRVGVSPTMYRKFRGVVPQAGGLTRRTLGGSVVRGTVTIPVDTPPMAVFVGLFPRRLTEGNPVRCAIVDAPGEFELDGVPDGFWHVVAHCVTEPAWANAPYVGYQGPVQTKAGVETKQADLELRPKRSFDPPVLLALPATCGRLPEKIAV